MKLHKRLMIVAIALYVYQSPVFSQPEQKDTSDRIRALTVSSENGDAFSQCELAKAYLENKQSSDRYRTAATWFQKAADQGSAEAQAWLGLMYETGSGFNQDYPEAEKWYLKAAEQGNAPAQLNLGFMYNHGRGRGRVVLQPASNQPSMVLVFDQPSGVVDQDYIKAVYWYRKAAEQGLDFAQSSLGWIYTNGWGVPRDNAEAVKWFEAAAQQWDLSALCMLGALYIEGKDIPRDLDKAYYWLDVCASSAAGQKRLMAGRIRDEIEKQLPPQQLQKIREKRKSEKSVVTMKLKNITATAGKRIDDPIDLISPKPAYTELARKERKEGIVVAECIIRKTGMVNSCRLIRSLGSGLDDSAINTIRTMWRFKPAMFEGNPVDYPVQIETVFKIY